MYIIACRAHFCHLLGLGQVGHSPRGTSGTAGTLDWGPMWSGSQSACHSQCSLTPPRSLQMPPYATYTISGLSTYTSCQPPMHPDTPTPPDTPLMAQCSLTPLHPLGVPNAHLCCLYSIWPQSTYTPCQAPIHPQNP